MNTCKMALATVLTLTASASFSFAEEISSPFYVGIDVGKLTADYKTFDGVSGSDFFNDSFTTVNPYVGYDLNDKVAFELGYLQTTTEDKNFTVGAVTGSSSLQLKGFHVDVLGKHKVSDKAELLGSVGLARLKADLSATLTAGSNSVSSQGDESDTALRFGLGGRYALSDSFAVRGMLRYMKVDFDDTTDSLMSYSVGLNYKF